MLNRRLGALAAACALALTATACSDDPAEPTPVQPSPTKSPTGSATADPDAKPRTVVFGAYGAPDELKAFDRAVAGFNAASVTRKVEVVTWPDHETALQDILAGEQSPDVFLTSRIDLGQLVENEAIRPVSLLLDERGVDFGDRFSRDAVDAFAFERELQCMAYSASPMVIYYNTDLIDFERMEQRGLDVPSNPTRWSLEEFAAAAQFASRRGERRGVWIEPSLPGLAPFIYSGGGKVYDDEDQPTSLAFSDDDTREALSRVLTVLRDASLTPTEEQLAERTPLQLFKRGKLGMIAGYRDLVPELRDVEGLEFDVIAMPEVDSRATVGDISGLCLSADSDVVADAADFIAYMVSDSAVETVTRSGYIVPANTEVASSAVFRDDPRMPASAEVFTSGVRHLQVAPFIADRTALVDAIAPLLDDMLTAPGTLDLEALTEQVDEVSRAILSPETVEPDESESPEESETPSE